MPVFDFNYDIIIRNEETGGILEVLAQVNKFGMAKAAFEAAIEEVPMATIVFRNGTRVIETAWTGAYDATTRTVELVKRER